MKKLVKFSLVASIALSSAYGAEVNSLEEMFKEGEVSGQIRVGHYSVDLKNSSNKDQYVTAIGGQLKYETAIFYGLSAGVAGYTSNSISALSGKQDLSVDANNKFESSLTSTEKNYTELAEAYINYTRDSFNLKVGRQQIDTPLADTDDWAMTPNTFEAVVASYTFKDLGLTLLGANVQRWQGVDSSDASYDMYASVYTNSWVDTGDGSTNMLAALYANDMFEGGVWYYDVNKAAKAVYVDASAKFALSKEADATLSAQYLDESEENNSNIAGSIAGAKAEISFAGVTLLGAYDVVSVNDGDSIFGGFGGGSSYTNMFITTATSLHGDDTYGDGKSYKASLGYEVMGVLFEATYGDFKADAIGAGDRGHLSEMDLCISHTYKDGLADVALGYVKVKDKIDSANSLNRIQFFANYNF